MDDLPAFVAIATLLIVTPGPDMALITKNALAHGRKQALLTGVGVIVGLFVWTGASVGGLAAVIAKSAVAFNAIKLAGAAYLVYLGIRTLLAMRNSPSDSSSHLALELTHGSAFRQGMLSNLLNPKIAVLFTSLIPQFVSSGPSAIQETVVLAAVFILLGIIWLTIYAFLASAAASWLQRPKVKRIFHAVTGTVLVGFGVRLAVSRAQ